MLVASVSAYALSVLILKRSVLTEKVARQGLHLTREYTTDPLEAFFAHEVVTPAPLGKPPVAAHPSLVVYGDQTLREVAVAFTRAETTIATVIDRADPRRTLGVISLAELLHARRHDLREEELRERLLTLSLRGASDLASAQAGSYEPFEDELVD
jgi:hypothetical protein